MKQTLTRIGEAVSQALTRERICESCGAGFLCGASLRGCWCAEITLGDAERAELQKRFRDCLCRDCLEKASQHEAVRP
ncbi:MAG TPA: cysteine-rich CWC family protein [Pyrinomonadaceae bacterium]|nr:cysteine-rich CWC family protein [Pyrinomonadaceae bacterium]